MAAIQAGALACIASPKQPPACNIMRALFNLLLDKLLHRKINVPFGKEFWLQVQDDYNKRKHEGMGLGYLCYASAAFEAKWKTSSSFLLICQLRNEFLKRSFKWSWSTNKPPKYYTNILFCVGPARQRNEIRQDFLDWVLQQIEKQNETK